MRLSHNLASLNIYKNYSKSLIAQSKAMKNISSGYKISSAKDDPNVIAQSEKIRMQIRGAQMASRNTQDTMSMLQTADGALDNMTSMLQRIRELTVQAGNGTYTPEDKATMQNEIEQLKAGYNDIAKNTEFNGNKLLSTAKTTETMVGPNSDEKIVIPFYDLTSGNIPSISPDSLEDLDVTTDISKSLDIIDKTLDFVTKVRSKYGALENRLESTYNNMDELSEKMENADSQLVDADVAEEMINYSKASILSQAGIAMMVQSNKFPQEVLNSLASVGRR